MSKCQEIYCIRTIDVKQPEHFKLNRNVNFSIAWIQITKQQESQCHYSFSGSTMDFYFMKIVAVKLNIIGQWISNWVAPLPNLNRHYVTASQYSISLVNCSAFFSTTKFINFSLSLPRYLLFFTVNVPFAKKFGAHILRVYPPNKSTFIK